MKHVALTSTNLKSCAWSPDKTLEIAFVKGKTYLYIGVPFVVYEGLMRSQSPGMYFDTHIRGKFPFRIVSANGNQNHR